MDARNNRQFGISASLAAGRSPAAVRRISVSGSARTSKLGARRWASAFAALAAALLASSPGSSLAGELRVYVNRLTCRDPTRVVAEIRRSVAHDMASQPDHILILDTPSPETLLLRLEGPEGIVERQTALSPDDCPALGSIVGLMIRGWLNRDWSAPPSVAPATSAAPSVRPVEPPPHPAPAPPLQTRWTAALALGGFATPDASPRASVVSALSLGRSLSQHLSASMRLGHDWPSVNPLAAGSISSNLWTLLASVGWAVSAVDAGAFKLTAGPELDLVSATSRGFPVQRTERRFDVAAVLGMEWDQQITRDLAAFAGLELALRGREEVFSVTRPADSPSAAFTLNRTRVRLLGGIAWTFIE